MPTMIGSNNLNACVVIAPGGNAGLIGTAS